MGLKDFGNASFNYISRDGNYAAHGVVREAINHVIDTIWMNKIPPCIYGIVKREEPTLSL